MIKIFDGSVLRRAVAVGSMALVCGLAVAPAAANAADSRCPANAFCLFENTNYGGGQAVFRSSDGNLNNNRYNNGHPVDNTASSMINNTGSTVTLYSGTYRSGSAYTARAYSVDASFANNGFDNVASSVYFS